MGARWGGGICRPCCHSLSCMVYPSRPIPITAPSMKALCRVDCSTAARLPPLLPARRFRLPSSLPSLVGIRSPLPDHIIISVSVSSDHSHTIKFAMFPSLLPSYSPLFLLCLLLFFFLLLSHCPPAAANSLDQKCGNTGTYTTNSTYASNLHVLLTFLGSNTSLSGGFSNATVGQIPNEIYGLALCRGDTNAPVCRSCVDNAIHDAPNLCPYAKGAIIWYDYCLLHYSNQRFLSTIDSSGEVMMYNVNNVADPSRFDKLLDVLMGRIADWAAYNSTEMFATGVMMNSTNPPSPTIYGLAQCTRDLSRSQCRQCLSGMLDPRPALFEGRRGARVLGGSCKYRYEIYSFYDGEPTLRLLSPLATTPAPPPLITPAGKEGKKTNVTGVVLAIAVPLVAAFVLISIICICFWRRKPAVKLPLDETGLVEIASVESLLSDISTI